MLTWEQLSARENRAATSPCQGEAFRKTRVLRIAQSRCPSGGNCTTRSRRPAEKPEQNHNRAKRAEIRTLSVTQKSAPAPLPVREALEACSREVLFHFGFLGRGICFMRWTSPGRCAGLTCFAPLARKTARRRSSTVENSTRDFNRGGRDSLSNPHFRANKSKRGASA
jgi:hypothetical protein